MNAQLHRYISESDTITRGPQTPQTRARLQFLLAAIKTMKTEFNGAAITAGEEERETRAELRDYFVDAPVESMAERRAALTDANTGQLVPASFYNQLLTGVAQYTELMDRNNVSLIESEKALPLTIPEIDLSTITSAIVAQGVDAPPVANPTISSMVLKGFSYRTNPIASTFELEQDSFEAITDILTRAFSVALARGIGSDLVNGAGAGTAPQGLLTAAANSGVTSTVSGVWSGIDLAAVYASLNRAYRVSPKCAWVMHDTTYQQIVALKDANSRPLLGIRDDAETLFGKRVLISPDMPVGAGAKSIVLGDLSQFQVRVVKNGVMVRRSAQALGYAEQGAALYTCYMRVDSTLNTAGGGVKPVVYATAHA
ncbi:MAG TPA: phage major capsid protein [Candidatus Binatus sp.]|jgi:HK97 family phage major capsid protein|nr:phage major capsid protein [Candidatus Binatus sp.]